MSGSADRPGPPAEAPAQGRNAASTEAPPPAPPSRPGADLRGGLLARNAVLNLAGLALPMAVAVFAVDALVDGLGAERFGILAIAWMLLSYLNELGAGRTTARFAAEAIGAGREDAVGPIAWTTAWIQIAIGAAEGVALALATPWLVGAVLNIPAGLEGEGRLCLYLLAAALPATGISKAFRGVLEAVQRFDLVTAVRLPVTTANYLLPVLGLALGWELPALFGLVLVGRIAAVGAFFALAVRCVPAVRRPRLVPGEWRRFLGFGGWTTVSTVISPALIQLDRFLLGAIVTMAAVAHYAAPYEVVARLVILPASIIGTLFPAFSQLVGGADWDRIAHLAARSVRAILVLLAPAVIVIVGGAADILRIWLGDVFAHESALAMQILAVGVIFNATAYVPFALLQGIERPDIPAKLHLLELPLHVLLAWLLIRRWGITGAAVAWSARVTLDAALLFAGAARAAPAPLIRSLVRERVPHALGVILIGGGLAAATASGIEPAGGRAALLAGMLAAAALAGWRYGVGPDERRRVRRLLRPGSAAAS